MSNHYMENNIVHIGDLAIKASKIISIETIDNQIKVVYQTGKGTLDNAYAREYDIRHRLNAVDYDFDKLNNLLEAQLSNVDGRFCKIASKLHQHAYVFRTENFVSAKLDRLNKIITLTVIDGESTTDKVFTFEYCSALDEYMEETDNQYKDLTAYEDASFAFAVIQICLES